MAECSPEEYPCGAHSIVVLIEKSWSRLRTANTVCDVVVGKQGTLELRDATRARVLPQRCHSADLSSSEPGQFDSRSLLPVRNLSSRTSSHQCTIQSHLHYDTCVNEKGTTDSPGPLSTLASPQPREHAAVAWRILGIRRNSSSRSGRNTID